ncbi:adenylate kinase isoenzyme 5 isoform X2 [Nasonia vitripennis]|nr:adenylate kinase isoenzyme 5 isoform X2 [Nasonia vitripennis]
MQNAGQVKFEPPTVPVIFVLGGPGSGKVTHCDNLTQEKKGIVHINMTDLLQQYALGNDMQDFGVLSSKTVTEVLMLEMKMSLGAKTFLVSGYPRNMRDVVEYSEKIQIVNGVILVAWKQEVLERQIDYGAQLGQVIIELARMELQNFYKNVMPVAEYFDQSEMLLVVNGERNPSEVYVDFRESVMRILGLSEESEAPERQVSSSMEAEVEVERDQDGELATSPGPADEHLLSAAQPPTLIGDEILPSKTADMTRRGLPPVVWVLGGPGSNKAMVCSQAIRKMSNWLHLSMGSLLVRLAASNPKVREALVLGEHVPTDLIMRLLEQQIVQNRDCNGIVIDGFPRDTRQARDFENKFGQRPEMLLLDVSKQQLGRGRLYDGVEAFGRRLELFRELSLPMLKSLDNQARLSIVDGDTELPVDRQQFASALLQLMRRAARNEDDPNRISVLQSEPEDEDVPKVSAGRRKPAANGLAKPVGNGVNHRANNEVIMGNGVAGGRKLPLANGHGPLKNAARKVVDDNRQQQNGHQPKPAVQQHQQHQQQQQKRQANGGPHLLQNGVARMANGFLPTTTNNRVAPARQPRQRQNGVATIGVDPIRRMYNEVEGGYDSYPPANLHI